MRTSQHSTSQHSFFKAWRNGALLGLLAIGASSIAQAQIPRINTFFPIGGKAGNTVDVEIRGSSLDGANGMLVNGRGVLGTVQPGGAKVDETFKPLWQTRCSSCHELRSPANRSLTPAQWAATVDRMVKVRGAPLSQDEADKVSQYLQGAARAGKITAQIKIASNVLPGLYELRIVTPRGVSTAGLFEVGNLPEVAAMNGTRANATPVTLPCVVNGNLAGNAERHFLKFNAKKDQRLVFNLKGFRYREASQLYFNPILRLYDSAGKELIENHGYYGLDPLIDWVCPADGEYTLEVHDLLGRGNPSSVYRLAIGALPYDTVLYPSALKAGTIAAVHVAGKNMEGATTSYTLQAPEEIGFTTVSSPYGPHTLYVSAYPVVTDERRGGAAAPPPTTLPVGFAGRIESPGETKTFPLKGEGRYVFEAFSGRVGSPAVLRISLLNTQGRAVNATTGETRMVVNLDAKETYTLQVEEINRKGGPEFAYYVEARPLKTAVECVSRPDNITLRPGTSTAVNVLLTRREGVEGDVTIRAENLPPGVTAVPAVIAPDQQDGWLLLTAAADAAPAAQPIRVMATARGPLGETLTRVTPQEEYKLNNQPRYLDRTECVIAVRGQANFTAALASDALIRVHPRKATEIKIKIKRQPDFKGPVTVSMVGLPRGWVASPETVPQDKDEVTLQVRPNGEATAPFLTRDPKMSPIRAVVLAQSDEFVLVIGTALVTRADRVDD